MDAVREAGSELHAIVQDLNDRPGPAVYRDPASGYIDLEGFAFRAAAYDLENGIRGHIVEFSPRLQAEGDSARLGVRDPKFDDVFGLRTNQAYAPPTNSCRACSINSARPSALGFSGFAVLTLR
jgi:hypothetical protein